MARFRKTKRRFTNSPYSRTGFVEYLVTVDSDGFLTAEASYYDGSDKATLAEVFGSVGKPKNRQATLRDLDKEANQIGRLITDLQDLILVLDEARAVIENTDYRDE